MTSHDDRSNVGVISLDEALRAAIRDSIHGEMPSPDIRESLLRAAAECEKMHVAARRAAVERQLKPARQESSNICLDWSARSSTISPATVLLLHAQILNLRVVQ